MFLLCFQERIIERLKEQRDRDDREKTEELDCSKKELKELKERLSLLQGDLSDREVRNRWRNTLRSAGTLKIHTEHLSFFDESLCFQFPPA